MLQDFIGDRQAQFQFQKTNFNQWIKRIVRNTRGTPGLQLQGKAGNACVIPRQPGTLELRLAGSKFVVFEKSSHIPFYEEPEPFVKAVNEFLRDK